MYDAILDKIFGEFGFLTNVFNTKPKQENFLAFFFGISCSHAATISSFAELIRWKTQSSLNRFLTESNWDLRKLNEKYQESLIDKMPQYFIIDDSKSEKTGSLIEKVHEDYDCSNRKTILCHTFVVSILKNNGQLIPYDLVLYEKKKSKLTIAADQIQKTANIVDKSTIYLFDSWYCNYEVINAIPKENCWISRLKRNRTIKIGDFWYKPPEILRLVKPWDYKKVKIRNSYFYVCSFRTKVKNLGEATVVIAKPGRYSKFAEFFVSNFDLEPEEILKHYSERWSIEVFFRTIKQDLGLNGYQMRSYKANRRYWSLVLLTYAILSTLQKFWKICKTIGQTIKKLKNYSQNYGRRFWKVIEKYVAEKNAKL